MTRQATGHDRPGLMLADARRRMLLAAVCAALGILASVLLLLTPGADAKQQFMSGFGQAFPAAAGSDLDSCVLCHTDPARPREGNLNQYGKDWENGDYGDKDFLAPALLNRDSDGDGVTNGAEIQQLSLPGDPASSAPPTTTTTLPGTPPDGQALYGARCAGCHGPDGGNLSGTGLARSTFITITISGQGSMPAQSNLTNEQVGAIWDYVTGTVPPTTTTTLPGATTTTTLAASGSTVWAQNCAACHGANGGNVVPTSRNRSQLVSIISNGIGSMRGFPELGSVQIGNVADYLLSQSTPTTTLPGATTTTTLAASGSTVWAQNCAACHGANGGNVVPTSRNRSQLVSIISNGIGSMRGFPELGSVQIGNVADYLLSQSTPTTTLPGATTTTTIPRSGAAVYAATCALCHGSEGANLRGHDLNLSEVISITTSGTGAMRGYAGSLSTAEIDNVARYVASFGSVSGVTTTTAPPGSTASGSILYMQSCSGCHGLHGEGGAGGAVAGTSLSRPDVISLINAGKSGMPGFGSQLSEAEIAAIADHLLGMDITGTSGGAAGGGSRDAGTAPAVTPELAEGRSLFGQFCASCHGANGEGGLGGPVTGVELPALREIIRRGTGTMPAFAGQMSDAELDALVAFVQGLASDESSSATGRQEQALSDTDLLAGLARNRDEPDGGGRLGAVVAAAFLGVIAAGGAAFAWMRAARNLVG